MKVTRLPLPGLLLIEPLRFEDERGWFMESWNGERYRAAGIDAAFVQDNLSSSRRGVLRGLHFQDPDPQGKLVWVAAGEVWDVAVDVRSESATFGRWYGCSLSAANARQLFIPEGFAHGFVTISDQALFAYKCTAPYRASSERTLRWDDPDLAIDWPVTDPILSLKDRQGMRLAELRAAR